MRQSWSPSTPDAGTAIDIGSARVDNRSAASRTFGTLYPLRPPDPPLAASSSICHAPCRNDGAGTFLHMHVEPVQSSRTKGGGSRKQEKEESGIRVSICDEAHLLP